MNKYEYEFITGQWSGPKGAAYNQVYEFCKEFGWLKSFSVAGEPVPTDKGIQAIKAYQQKQNYLRVDVI